MIDFSWTQAHAFLRPRSAVEAAFEQLGYTFTVSQLAKGRLSRPRSIGVTANQRARIELIGPVEVVFKATLLLVHQQQHDPSHKRLHSDLVDFLTILIPDWDARAEWITNHLPTVQGNQQAETRFHDLGIVLRTSGDGSRIVLGVTWGPDGNA